MRDPTRTNCFIYWKHAELHLSKERGVPATKKWQRGNPNPTLPMEYDLVSEGREAGTTACFAVLHQNKHGDVHFPYAGWPTPDLAAEQRKLR